MSNLEENKMGTMPAGKLLVSMSVPMILSMLVQALYNIVDSYFVSQYSDNALTAVTMAFPAQTLMIALAGGTGVGVNALLSYNLGRKDYKNASNIAKHGVFLATLSALLFLVLGLFFSEFFYAVQFNDAARAENPVQVAEVIAFGKDYLGVVTIFGFGMYMQMMLERLLQATGRTTYTMVTQMVGAVLNIVLDYALVLGKLGCPAMGAEGAAIATVIGQWVAMFLALFFNIAKNKEISLNFRGFRPNLGIIKNIYRIGLPSIIMQSISSVVTFAINNILLGFSKIAVDVFGVYFKLQSFIFMPVFGLNNGMVPIVAYNYGAGRRKRIMSTLKLSYAIAVAIMTIGTVVFELFPEPLLRIFTNSEETARQMIEYGVPAFRIIAVHFPVAAFCIITTSALQALGNGLYSLIASLCRQVFALLPVAWIMGKVIGRLDLVWWSYPIAETVSCVFCTIFLIRVYRNQLKKLPD